MNPTRRSFFGKLGIGAAVAAVFGRNAKAEKPKPGKPGKPGIVAICPTHWGWKLPSGDEAMMVFIRKDGMLVDGEGKELGFALITPERNPAIYPAIEKTRHEKGNYYGSPLVYKVVDGETITAASKITLITKAPQQLKPYKYIGNPKVKIESERT